MAPLESSSSRCAARLRIPVVVIVLAVALSGCESGPEIPEGKTLRGDTEAFRSWLSEISALEGTRAAGLARRLDARVEGCERFVAHCQEPECDLLETLECSPEGPATSSVTSIGSPESDWSLSWREDDEWVLVDAIRSPDPGARTTRLEVLYHPTDREGVGSLVRPGTETPEPADLGAKGRFAHLRLRPEGGLDLTRWLPEEGWASRLYRLRSDLFTANAFEGSLELGIYEPPTGDLVPPTALGVPLSDPELAVAGLETFSDEIREVWPVRLAPFRFGELEGVCAINLDILPDLAPCYVVRDDVLILGWNPPSVSAALMGSPSSRPSGPTGRDEGGFHLRLDLRALERVDATIRRQAEPEASDSAAVRYPWERLDARGRRRGDSFQFQILLSRDSGR